MIEYVVFEGQMCRWLVEHSKMSSLYDLEFGCATFDCGVLLLLQFFWFFNLPSFFPLLEIAMLTKISRWTYVRMKSESLKYVIAYYIFSQLRCSWGFGGMIWCLLREHAQIVERRSAPIDIILCSSLLVLYVFKKKKTKKKNWRHLLSCLFFYSVDVFNAI